MYTPQIINKHYYQIASLIVSTNTVKLLDNADITLKLIREINVDGHSIYTKSHGLSFFCYGGASDLEHIV